MSRKITLGKNASGGRAKASRVDIPCVTVVPNEQDPQGPPITTIVPDKVVRYTTVPYNRDLEDELEEIGQRIDEIQNDDDLGNKELVEVMVEQLDLMLELVEQQTLPEGAQTTPSEAVLAAYNAPDSQLTATEIAKTCSSVGKEVRPT